MKEVLAIIPARVGSKRLKGKNTRMFLGKPLITHTIDRARESTLITRIVISSDDDKVGEIAKEESIEFIRRPEELARDTSTSAEAVIHAVSELRKEGYVPDIIVLLQPTSPLRSKEDIDSAIEPVLTGKAESTQTVSPVSEHPALMVTIDEAGRLVPYDKENHLKRTQEFPPVFIKNGSVFVFLSSVLAATGNIYGKEHRAVITPRERSIDIDDLEDFVLAEFYHKRLLSEGVR